MKLPVLEGWGKCFQIYACADVGNTWGVYSMDLTPWSSLVKERRRLLVFDAIC